MKSRQPRTRAGTLDLSLLGFGDAPLGNLYVAGIPAALWSDLKAEGLIRPDAPVPAGPLA